MNWKKDVLWLLGIVYASENIQVVSNIDKFISHIISQVNMEQQYPNFAVVSEGLICIYNLFSNFESQVLINFLENTKMESLRDLLFKSMSQMLESEIKSPYMIQISISFWLLICEIYQTQKFIPQNHNDELSQVLEKYQVSEKIEKVIYSKLGIEN